MAGRGVRMGDKATVNFGRTWGSTSRLPNGVAVSDPVTDDNVLNNLGNRTVKRWFLGLSYSFIDRKERLLKPFAEAPPSTVAKGAAAPAADAATLSAGVQANIKALANDPDNYKNTALKKLLKPDGPATICKVEVSPAGKVVVHLKDAAAGALDALPKSVGDDVKTAIDDLIKAKGGGPVKEPVEFVDGACS